MGTTWGQLGDDLGMTWALLWHNLARLWHTLAHSGILWHTLACSGILWHNHCIILTADGAYHCPLGSIWPFFEPTNPFLVRWLSIFEELFKFLFEIIVSANYLEMSERHCSRRRFLAQESPTSHSATSHEATSLGAGRSFQKFGCHVRRLENDR